ncbi:Plastocyanin-like domain [Musa troglodytarum]|uniref:Plastocyanin-like domain n=1 Tax=Musa troglodytarum TaxID=320322 RepID=A0A9E7JWH5_9LILI|nr:Plastocyanin-like domain [Musa troglodytarum]
MASPIQTKFFPNLLLFLSIALLLSSAVSAYEFRVGGPRGWTKPTGDELGNYNHWATKNRFHVGDSLYFKYENDSVLVVDKNAYKECNTTDPQLKFVDGNTTFRFDRHGYFYFISGKPGHCEAGERLIVRVMVHSEVMPGAAPSSQPGGGSANTESGAALKTTTAAAMLMAALGSLFAISMFS